MEAGYLTSYHEGKAYVHWSNGERWAEIDPYAETIEDLRSTYVHAPKDHAQFMAWLSELADYGTIKEVVG